MALIIAQKVNQYIKAGTPIFVYEIKSSETEVAKAKEELDAYKKSQGDYYRESEAKKPIYFSQRPVESGSELSLTKGGRYQVLRDLEGVAEHKEAEAVTQEAKLEAIRRFTGLSKAQMAERLLAKF